MAHVVDALSLTPVEPLIGTSHCVESMQSGSPQQNYAPWYLSCTV
jgi:hypothetical protein